MRRPSESYSLREDQSSSREEAEAAGAGAAGMPRAACVAASSAASASPPGGPPSGWLASHSPVDMTLPATVAHSSRYCRAVAMRFFE